MWLWISRNGIIAWPFVTLHLIVYVYTAIYTICTLCVGRLVTGWAVRGSNPGEGEIFRACPDRPWSPPSLLYNGYRLFSPGGKAAVTLITHLSSSAVVEETVALYLHSTSGPSLAILGWTLPYLYTACRSHIGGRNYSFACVRVYGRTVSSVNI